MRDFKTNQDIMLETYKYLRNLQDLNHNSIKKLESVMETRSRALDALKIVETIFNDIARELTRFHLGIDAMRQGILSTMLITPENLSTYSNNINVQLNTGSTLPLVVTPNTIHGYYDILETCLLYTSRCV